MQFPEEILSILSLCKKEGLRLYLVGGAVRKYLETQSFPKDLDFEIRHTDLMQGKIWEDKLNSFFDSLPYKVTKGSFCTFQFPLGNYDLEFASPREEFFQGSGHSDFLAEFSSQLDFSKAFARRDFTVNALAIDVENKDWIDPFGGRKDWEDKVLRPCGVNFDKDPVRFCRMVRFSLILGFEFSGDAKFDLSELTTYYFFKEAEKSHDIGAFVRKFSHNLTYCTHFPKYWEKVKFLGQVEEKIERAEEMISYLVHENIEAKEFVNIVGHSKRFKTLKSFYQKKEEVLDFNVWMSYLNARDYLWEKDDFFEKIFVQVQKEEGSPKNCFLRAKEKLSI